jgi:hypothetical protein
MTYVLRLLVLLVVVSPLLAAPNFPNVERDGFPAKFLASLEWVGDKGVSGDQIAFMQKHYKSCAHKANIDEWWHAWLDKHEQVHIPALNIWVVGIGPDGEILCAPNMVRNDLRDGFEETVINEWGTDQNGQLITRRRIGMGDVYDGVDYDVSQLDPIVRSWAINCQDPFWASRPEPARPIRVVNGLACPIEVGVSAYTLDAAISGSRSEQWKLAVNGSITFRKTSAERRYSIIVGAGSGVVVNTSTEELEDNADRIHKVTYDTDGAILVKVTHRLLESRYRSGIDTTCDCCQ